MKTLSQFQQNKRTSLLFKFHGTENWGHGGTAAGPDEHIGSGPGDGRTENWGPSGTAAGPDEHIGSGLGSRTECFNFKTKTKKALSNLEKDITNKPEWLRWVSDDIEPKHLDIIKNTPIREIFESWGRPTQKLKNLLGDKSDDFQSWLKSKNGGDFQDLIQNAYGEKKDNLSLVELMENDQMICSRTIN